MLELTLLEKYFLLCLNLLKSSIFSMYAYVTSVKKNAVFVDDGCHLGAVFSLGKFFDEICCENLAINCRWMSETVVRDENLMYLCEAAKGAEEVLCAKSLR